MIKSKILKILSITALLCAAFSFIACGGNGAGGGDDEGNSSGNGDNSGSSSGATFTGPTAEQKAKLAALDGWELKVYHSWSATGGAPEPEEWIMGEKDNVFWFDIGTGKTAIEKDGDASYFYSWDETENKYECTMVLDKSSYDTMTLAVFTWLYYKDSYSGIQLSEAGTETICGRACKKYTGTDSAVGNGSWVSATITFWTDNEIGITMKAYVSGSTSEGTETYTHEVKEFKTGSQVSSPTLSAPAQS